MLRPIRPETNRVATGRRFAARSVVITHLSALDSFVFRREVDAIKNGETRAESIYPGAELLSSQEEHATRYEDLGYAKILLDNFIPGSVFNDYSDINVGEVSFNAQVEPYFIENADSGREMLKNVPDWRPRKGDVFALIIDADTIKWIECVGSMGQSLTDDHGEKYVFNVRDSLSHLEPFIHQEELLKPASNIFPIKLSVLNYSAAPIFDVVENDPVDLSDDLINARMFKLININDPLLKRNIAVVSLFSMAEHTNSALYFNQQDAEKIMVSLGDNETFVLTSETAVHAVTANQDKISYVSIAIDHPSLVAKIKAQHLENTPVQIIQDETRSFEILPTSFDVEHKFYIAVLLTKLGNLNNYKLKISDHETYSFSLDLTNVEGTP